MQNIAWAPTREDLKIIFCGGSESSHIRKDDSSFTGKEQHMTLEQITRLVELMARSKAVWMVPELLHLTESAESPNHAYDLVLSETGKRKKALAARWYAIAKREFDPDLVGACGRWLKYTKRGTESLKQFLSITFKP